MGVIQSGILGPVSGKVSGVVGGRWKDKAYLRGYTKPANPNTLAQQAQRTLMADCVAFAKLFVGQVFNAYTDAFIRNMSGFNFFIKSNIAVFDGTTDYSAIKMTEGPLSPIIITDMVYNSGSGGITGSYSKNLGSNGLDTDKVFFMVYDASSGRAYFVGAEEDRSTESLIWSMQTGLTATNLHMYALVAQYSTTGKLMMISNSAYFHLHA